MDNNHRCPYMFKSTVHFQQKLDLMGRNRFRVLVRDDQGDNNHHIVGLIYDWCGVKIHPGHVSHGCFDCLHLDKLFIPVILWDCATVVLIATSTIEGGPQCVNPPLLSWLPSMSAGTVLTRHDGDIHQESTEEMTRVYLALQHKYPIQYALK